MNGDLHCLNKKVGTIWVCYGLKDFGVKEKEGGDLRDCGGIS